MAALAALEEEHLHARARAAAAAHRLRIVLDRDNVRSLCLSRVYITYQLTKNTNKTRP